MQRPARIGIDCRLGGLRHAGIGRYIVELVSRLVVDDSFVWVLFCTDQDQAQEILGSTNKLPSHVELVITPIPHYTLQEQLKLPRLFSRANIDLLHVPHFNAPIFYRGSFVLTVHDLLWHERRGTAVTTLPWYSYWLKYLGYRFVARTAIYRARHICVPSKTVAQAIATHYSFAANKISVTKEGIASSLLRQVPHVKKTTRKNRQLLYVGSLYPHKNVELIIQALHNLPQYTLTIVSARSVFRSSVEKGISTTLRKRVTFVDEANDAQLARLYATSQALIQPSFSEGFGLTGLEAMAFDTPIIASDIPVFREIYGGAAIYISPDFAPSLVRAVRELEEASTRKALLAEAKKVRAQYTWDATTRQTRQIFQNTLEQTVQKQ